MIQSASKAVGVGLVQRPIYVGRLSVRRWGCRRATHELYGQQHTDDASRHMGAVMAERRDYRDRDATTEPYTAGYANADGLFSKFWFGYNFGEARIPGDAVFEPCDGICRRSSRRPPCFSRARPSSSSR